MIIWRSLFHPLFSRGKKYISPFSTMSAVFTLMTSACTFGLKKENSRCVIRLEDASSTFRISLLNMVVEDSVYGNSKRRNNGSFQSHQHLLLLTLHLLLLRKTHLPLQQKQLQDLATVHPPRRPRKFHPPEKRLQVVQKPRKPPHQDDAH